MSKEQEKISCHICKKEIPKAAALTAEGKEYVLNFCDIGCLDYWNKEKKEDKHKDMEDKMCNNDLFCGINSAQSTDVAEMSDLEKKHTPVIEAPGRVKNEEAFVVTVEVGKLLPHPNENGHYIEWIELYSGDTFLARTDLIPRLTSPKISFTVALDHEHALIAKARCNMHGVWQSFPHQISVE